MKIYRVGGYIRDKLLGRYPNDCDYVVTESSTEEMLNNGFIQVGKSFPVFIHPKTREEYALARVEKKSGHGHTGFTVQSSSDVTLEEDLWRRDLTINAIAEDENGNLIDPYNGIADIKNKVLRHISPAFVDDPLRVLRIARFCAQLEFTVAPETLELLKSMKLELLSISRERIIIELEKALQAKSCHLFFELLYAIDCLDIIFPNLYRIIYKASFKQVILPLKIYESKLTIYENMLLRYLLLSNKFRQNNLTFAPELTLKKSTIMLCNDFYALCCIDMKNPDSIYNIFKKIDLWRNQQRFIELMKYYELLYSIKILPNISQPNTIKLLAEQLYNCHITDLINSTNTKEIAQKIKLRYLNLITNTILPSTT